MTRVAVVDIGTNSTRLLIADVDAPDAVTDLHRESIVTRLGHAVDATGRLDEEAMERVFATLSDYREKIDAHGASRTTAVLTSAVRDASNGPEFAQAVKDRFGLDAQTIDGDEEAALTFAGATSERPDDHRQLLVIDIGGGSTELVIGRDGRPEFHASTQVGVVRQTERHLHHDPPEPDELVALGEEVAQTFADAVPDHLRENVDAGIAVAGTATTSAAIELELEPYDPARAHGHVLELGVVEMLLARLAQMPEADRRQVVGLHPDRAPIVVAGLALLLEAMRAFGLERVEVSEHDILRGVALRLAGVTR